MGDFYKIYLVQFLLVHICLFNINFSQYEDKFVQVAMSNKPGSYKGYFFLSSYFLRVCLLAQCRTAQHNDRRRWRGGGIYTAQFSG